MDSQQESCYKTRPEVIYRDKKLERESVCGLFDVVTVPAAAQFSIDQHHVTSIKRAEL